MCGEMTEFSGGALFCWSLKWGSVMGSVNELWTEGGHDNLGGEAGAELEWMPWEQGIYSRADGIPGHHHLPTGQTALD